MNIEIFADKDSIAREILGKGDTILLIFAGLRQSSHLTKL